MLIISTQGQAEVINSAVDGFQLEITTEVKQSASNSYQQFLKINEWWNPEHTWFGSAENLTLKPSLGGCFCERVEGKEVEHMRVVFVQPNKEFRMIGGLGPLQMMALNGVMSWQFESLSPTSTKITQRYNVSGSDYNQLDKLAAIVDRVQSEQQDRLTELLNTQY